MKLPDPGPEHGPRVTLAICSRNRAASLARCLAATQRLEAAEDWELVLVDNGSGDGTAALIERFRAAASFPVVAVHEPAPGLGRARNAALAAATGDLVAFTDDDCYAAPDFIARARAAFADAAVGYVTGRVVQHDPQAARTAINDRARPYDLPPRSYVRPGRVLGANLAFRRSVLQAIGGFDPELGSGTAFPAEDCDAAARAGAAGWRGRYVPDLVVRHDHGRSADEEQVRRSYDIGRGAYHAKLLAHRGTFLAGLRGWLELGYRAWLRPASLRWEVTGAWRWLRRQRPPPRP